MSANLKLLQAPSMYRIELIRAGVRPSKVKALARSLGLQEMVLMNDLGIRRASMKVARFQPAASERLIGLMTLVGQVEAMVPSMDPTIDFDAAKWLGAWLDSPLPALGGVRPGSYLDTMAGQDLLATLIAMAQSGAYA
jgi:hypothetical protein